MNTQSFLAPGRQCDRLGNANHRRHRTRSARLAVMALLFSLLTGVASAATKEEQQRELRSMASTTLTELYRFEPGARDVIKRAAGYAVFSNFGLKILVAGTGKGKGIAINNRTGKETFMKVLELQAGLGFGVKKYRLVWVFDSSEAFDNFVNKGWQLGGQASFSAKAQGKGGGVAGAASVDKDVWLYQINDKGLAAEVTVKGSRYYKDAALN